MVSAKSPSLARVRPLFATTASPAAYAEVDGSAKGKVLVDAAEGSAEDAEIPRRPRDFHVGDASVLVGSAISSFALTWLIFERLAPLDGALGFALTWFGAFAGIYWFVVNETEGRLAAADRVAAAVIAVGALALLVPLVLIVGYVVVKGVQAMSPAFFTKTLQFVGPLDDAKEGGALHAIVGTLEQVAIAVVISVPLGVLTAIYLNEVGGRFARPVRMVVDAMSGVPSIVAGLFVYAIWIVQFQNDFSGLAAGFALSILMLPTITRTSEEVLRLVPGGLREGALALGAPEWRATWSVVLPTARAGVITAVVLGMARAAGETAPLIMTSFGASVMNANALKSPQDSLPLFVFNLIRSPQPAQIARAWTGALVLVVLVLVLFSIARAVGSGGASRSIARVMRRFRGSAE